MKRLLTICLLLIGLASPAFAQSLTLLTMEPGIVGQTNANTPFFPMTGYGTYTVTAPSSATGTWTGCGGGSATIRFFILNPYSNATFAGTNGTYMVGAAAPSTAGVGCTLTITTNLGTSATSPPTTVYSFPSGGTVVSNIHNAPGWIHSHAYAPGSGPKTRVNNGAGWTESTGTWNPGSALNAYELTSGSCTSAASGGPTGTGSSISDGTCTWKYLSGTDYVTLSGYDLDAPAWSSGVTYTYGQYVTTNSAGNFRSYSLDTLVDTSVNGAAAFCTSTTAPSGTGTRSVLADGCVWTYMGTVIYSSGASTIPFNTYQTNNTTVFSAARVSHLSRSYQASLWNDREYVFGSNGENFTFGLYDHQGGGHCCGGETAYIACYLTGGGNGTIQDIAGCPTVTFKPADGEGFAASLTTSTPLTGYDATKGVALLSTTTSAFPFFMGDMNMRIDGLQIKSTVTNAVLGFNNEIITNNIIDGGFPGVADGAAVWLDVPDVVANNLIISHGPVGLAFKYGSSVALFNTIANVGSTANAVCISYTWAWVWTNLVAANNACYNFPHFGSFLTSEGTQVFDSSSKNNVTDTASPDSGTNVPNAGDQTGNGTVMIVPNSTYNASGSAMFVSPGSDWRPGTALRGAGASYGTFSWGCTSPAAGCVTASLNYDTPDFLGNSRPTASQWTVGAEQFGGTPPPYTLTAINLSGNTFTYSCAPSTVIGHVTVPATGGTFSSALSLTGVGGGFQLSSTSIPSDLISNSSTGCPASGGPYSLNIVATDGAAVGSPKTQAETLTGSGGTPPPTVLRLGR